jgi:colanic acid/amylovoran/stewartan biosynthesis glycosyltransferase WcaL/AmsK/CpsK
MLRVLHVRDTFLRQTETFIYDLYRRMSSVDAHFACERTKNLDQFPAENIHSINDTGATERIYNEATRRLEHRFPFYDELAASLKPHVIHAHFGPTGFFCLESAKASDAKLVTSFYGQDVFEVPAKARWKRRYKTLFERGDLFLALSEDMRGDLIELGCPEEKIEIYRLGIDLEQFEFTARPKRKTFTVLTIARLVEKKGIEYLIKAVAEMDEPNVFLSIVGDGPLREELEKLAGESGAADRIDFLGTRPFSELAGLIEAADVFCLPSVTDRFGGKDEISMVLKEAMASGLPIVATIHAGIPEVITEGQEGFLLPEKEVQSLAKAFSTLAADRDLRIRMGRAGRELVERVWDIDKQTDRLREIYLAAAQSKAGESL